MSIYGDPNAPHWNDTPADEGLDLSFLSEPDEDDGEDEEWTDEELLLLAHFYDQSGGDLVRAAELMGQYEQQMEQANAGPSTADDEDAETAAWLDAHPDIANDPQALAEIGVYLQHTEGDLDEALAMHERSQQVLNEVAREQNLPKTFDDAFNQSVAEGLIGGRGRYQFQRGGRDDDLDAAVGELTEQVSATAGLRRLAREQVRDQS